MTGKCDKCNTEIIKGECSCGLWFERYDQPEISNKIEQAILAYNFLYNSDQINTPLSGDHYTGTCIVLFKGSYEDSQLVKDFIINLNKG